MKKRIISLICLAFCLVMTSCKYHVPYNEAGMQKLQKDLFDKFGENAWYSEISILSVSDNETALRVKETADPNSLRAKAWLKQSEDWIPQDEVMLQFNDGTPKEHLFQLSKGKMSLKTLADLIAQSNAKLKEKGLGSAKINFVSIQSAQLVKSDAQRVIYNISYENKSDNKSYSFVYDMNGKLVSFNQ